MMSHTEYFCIVEIPGWTNYPLPQHSAAPLSNGLSLLLFVGWLVYDQGSIFMIVDLCW